MNIAFKTLLALTLILGTFAQASDSQNKKLKLACRLSSFTNESTNQNEENITLTENGSAKTLELEGTTLRVTILLQKVGTLNSLLHAAMAENDGDPSFASASTRVNFPAKDVYLTLKTAITPTEIAEVVCTQQK